MNEAWKVFPRDDRYEVSSLGRIRKSGNKKIIAGSHNNNGYRRIGINRTGGQSFEYRVHHMVLESFVGPRPEGKQCNHINGVKDDNRLENLEWVTTKENCLHRCQVLGHNTGERSGLSKLSESQVREMIRRGADGQPFTRISIEFGISASQAWKIVNRQAWKHVS